MSLDIAVIGTTHYLCGEGDEEGEPEVAEGKGEVLVKEVSQELAHAVVRPASMHQQKTLWKYRGGR